MKGARGLTEFGNLDPTDTRMSIMRHKYDGDLKRHTYLGGISHLQNPHDRSAPAQCHCLATADPEVEGLTTSC